MAAPDQSFENPDGVDVHLDERGEPRIVTRRFVVEDEADGLRLDVFLKRKIPRLSRTRLQKIVRDSVESCEGRPVKPRTVVAAGETYILRRPARPEPPCPRWFDILHRDDQLMVIDKPAGLPVHISAKFYFNTLTRVVSERFPDEGWQIGHRIDRETSGVMALARGKSAAAAVKSCFADKRASKAYLAIVHGVPAWNGSHRIELPLGLTDVPDARISIRMIVRDDGAPSITDAKVLEHAGDFALLECRPITGRQHQIRAHLAAVGYPIVGDKLYTHGDDAFAAYCDTGMTDALLERFLLPRQALHAAELTIPHPATGELTTFRAPMPAELRAFLDDQR